MKEAKDAVESALVDNQRASLIRATKMSAAACRLFVDFLFVDSSAQIDSITTEETIVAPSGIIKNMFQITT
jgi:hypothetical protein